MRQPFSEPTPFSRARGVDLQNNTTDAISGRGESSFPQESSPSVSSETLSADKDTSPNASDLHGEEHTKVSVERELGVKTIASSVEIPEAPKQYTIAELAEKWDKEISVVFDIIKSFQESHADQEFDYINRPSKRPVRIFTAEQVAMMEGKYGMNIPEDSVGISELAQRWGESMDAVKNTIAAFQRRYPNEKIGRYRRGGRLKPERRLTAEQLAMVEAERPKSPPDNALSNSELAEKWGASESAVATRIKDFRKKNPEFKPDKYKKDGRLVNHLSLEQVAEIERELKITNRQAPPAGLKTLKELEGEWGVDTALIYKWFHLMKRRSDQEFARYQTPESGIKELTHLTPEQVATLEGFKVNYERAQQKPSGLTGLKTLKQVAGEWGIGINSVRRWVGIMTREYPDQELISYAPSAQATRAVTCLTTEQIEILNSLRAGNLANHDKETNTLKEDFSELLHELEGGESSVSQDFQSLIGLFGAERAIDILYQQHPEYKKLPVPYVKSMLAGYLGDFLKVSGQFSLSGLEKAEGLLAVGSFRDSLTEVVKNDCLKLLNRLARANPEQVTMGEVENYINHIRSETAHFTSPDLETVLGEVEAYYGLLFENIHKPSRFIDELELGRTFPDINQRINVQELAFKQKILIADEMGTGKSASAIMAKEIIGSRQALIVVPSNVMETWQGYLSDRVGENGEQIGYFKPGENPSVLVVDSLETLLQAQEQKGEYEYIVISHERLTPAYTEALKEFGYDMLIVDEAHKFKNITDGKRSGQLVSLAENVQGDGQYLALLTGTPAPNRVGDIALTLKLLYPEQFAEVDDSTLVSQIINGDMIDLRSLLVPRMQMKSLAESVKMPKLTERTHTIPLSAEEKEIYNILIEEDELTASEKLTILRQSLLNPHLLDATPNFESSKMQHVGAKLREAFENKDKIVMFFNGYVEGVMRGDTTIFSGLGLPEEVEIFTIDGSVDKERRAEIQRELRYSNKKMLLAVSGQTAGVGVNFSSAQEVFFYNEPWTEYDKHQQLSRVYRPGLQADLESHTFITEDTIEQGIHEYIEKKYQAVEKLLRGIPVSEIEKEMLRQEEKTGDPGLEVNADLAKYYFSSSDKMMRIFGHVKEMGEPRFKEFLEKYGEEYANSYVNLVGTRSYQANTSRLSSTIIDHLVEEKGQDPNSVIILDVASGPEMLRRHAPERIAQRVISMDINGQYFDQSPSKKLVGSFVNVPVADGSVDYVNLSLALHYTSLGVRQKNFERLEVFQEVSRVLKPAGQTVISVIQSLSLQDTEAFRDALGKMGLKIMDSYSGNATSGKHFNTQILTLEKIGEGILDTQMLVDEIGSPGLRAFKFKKGRNSAGNPRKILKDFSIENKQLPVSLNSNDSNVLAEEERLTQSMESLKQQYKTIETIPKEEIHQRGFSRIFNGKRYILFKQLSEGHGAVVVR